MTGVTSDGRSALTPCQNIETAVHMSYVRHGIGSYLHPKVTEIVSIYMCVVKKGKFVFNAVHAINSAENLLV